MLGFSIQSIARDVAHVATDPRAQALVAAGAQAYAPDSTARVVASTQQALQTYHQARHFVDRATGRGYRGPRPMMMMPADQVVADDGGPVVAPVQHGKMLPLLVGGGALVLILVLLKR